MQAKCALYGGKLTEIESSEENEWIKGELRKAKPGIDIMLVVVFIANSLTRLNLKLYCAIIYINTCVLFDK